MIAQVLGEPSVLLVDTRPVRQVSQPLDIILVSTATTILVGVLFIEAITQSQCVHQQVDHLLRKDFAWAGLLFHEFACTPQRMIDALLMGHVLETLVGRKTIVSHAARPVDADDFFQDTGTALRVDGVERGSIITDPAVEPGGAPSDTPPRFVGSEMIGAFDVLLDLFVNGSEDCACSLNDLSRSAGGQGNAKQLIERVGDFPMRHAGMLVEVNDGRLCVTAELALSSADGVAGLERMPATQKLAAFFALAAMDGEFADDGLARNLGLKLSIKMIFDDIATTTGTVIWQNRVEFFIDPIGGRRLAMGVLAVLLARLTARLFRLLFRLALRERCRLSLGGAFEIFEAFLEFADGLLKPRIFFA